MSSARTVEGAHGRATDGAAGAVASSLLSRRDAIVVFSVFAFAYFFSAMLRAVTATLSPTLTREFALNAQELGLLAGGFFLGFAATQVPLGMCLDRFGPRKVMLGFLSIAAAGCVAFSLATTFAQLLLARVLCGVGVAACLMAPLTGSRRWLTPTAQLRSNSWMLMTGSFGMVASTLPVQWLLPLAGWRPLFWALALGIGIAMAVIAWKVPRQPAEAAESAEPDATLSYAHVWRHPYLRKLAPLGFCSYGGMIAIQTLWAGPWMVRVAGYPPLQAATGLFIINLAMLGAFWSWGMFTPWLLRRGWTTDSLIAWGLPSSFVALAAILIAGPAAGAVAWAFFCVSSTVVALAQPAVGMVFSPKLAGRGLTAYNLILFSGVFVVQWGIGLLIDGFMALGLPEVTSFRCALAVFLACSLAAYGHFLLAKDNSCR
jgi:MFS family permease